MAKATKRIPRAPKARKTVARLILGVPRARKERRS
jgi:hypothetical protein